MNKKRRSLHDWLKDVVEWGERVATHLDGVDEQTFLADQLRQDAVIRCIECVGEASRNLLQDPRSAELSDLELYEAYWARNRLSHGYYDLNMDRVWATATISVPRLVADAREALRRLEE